MKRQTNNIVRVLKLATPEEIRAGMRWYANARKETLAIHPDIRIGAAVVAAMSPGLRWERNIEAARRVIAGEDLAGLGVRWYRNVHKARFIASGHNPDVHLKGNKVRAFRHCILYPESPLAVCIDGHAWCIWKGCRRSLDKVPTITNGLYRSIEAAYVEAAEELGLVPSQLQAITWVTWRRLNGITK